MLAQAQGPRVMASSVAIATKISDAYLLVQNAYAMTANVRAKGRQDRARVNFHEEWERHWRCNHYGVNEERLKEAVEKVGVSAEKVKEYLGVEK
jgi:hypothetical protein